METSKDTEAMEAIRAVAEQAMGPSWKIQRLEVLEGGVQLLLEGPNGMLAKVEVVWPAEVT